MSYNNLVPGSILTNANGQLFTVVAPSGNTPFGIRYFPIGSHSIETTPALSAPPRLPTQVAQTPQQQLSQLQLHFQTTQQQLQLNHQQHPLPHHHQPSPQVSFQRSARDVATPLQVEPSYKPQTKDQTNAKIKGIKEKCISHYIDGQLIIETTKPLNGKKLKSSKKKQLQQAPQLLHPQNQVAKSQPQNNHTHQQQLQNHQPLQVPPATQNHVAQITLTPGKASQPSNSLDNVTRLRAEMKSWTVEDVVKFIESHEEIKQYSYKFAGDEIDGRALLLIIDNEKMFSVLASMLKHGPAVKVEAVLSRYKSKE